MKKTLPFLLALTFIITSINPVKAQLTLSLTNQTERVDFDSTKSGVNQGTYVGNGITPNPAAGELNSNAWEIVGMSSGIFNYGDSSTTGDFARGTTTRGVGTGGLYSFESTNDGKFMGIQPAGSDMTPGTITLKVNNNTGVQIDTIKFSYTFYSYSDQPSSSELNPSYSVDNINYTALSNLNDTTQAAINTIALTVGRQKNATIPLTLSNGGSLYLRWSTDDNISGGARDEFGVDNIEVMGINASGAVSASTMVTSNASCNGSSNGSGMVTTSGGTSPYTYMWSNGSSSNPITNLSAGTYTVTVTDANGSTVIDSIMITQPDSIDLNLIGSDIACFGDSTGLITTMVSGGNGRYSYSWSTGDTTSNLDSLPVGIYTLTVTDSLGCSASGSDTLFQNSQMNIAISSTPASCYGDTSGSVQAILSGATPPYAFTWSTGDTGMTSDTTMINNISAGTYSLTVTDALGCESTSSAIVTEPDSLDLSSVVMNASSSSSSDGSIDLSVSGGTQPYSYVWDDPSSQTSQDIGNLPVGQYCVIVSDVNMCSKTLCDSVRNAMSVGLVSLKDNENSIKVYPNPSDGRFTLELSNHKLIGKNFQLLNISGKLVRQNILPGQVNKLDFSGYKSGIYYLRIEETVVRLIIN